MSDGLAGLAEQVTNRVLKPLGLVVLTAERIEEVLDDAAERGRITRSDASELAEQLISRGRRQTDELLAHIGQSLPILGYDDLTAAQVQPRLEGLSPAELRKVREYERRHANRKSVLAAIDKSLAPH